MSDVTCDYQGCNLPGDPDRSNLCMLHITDPNKDVKEFNRVLEEKIKRDVADASVNMIDLSGVVFPDETDFSKRTFEKAVSFRDARFLKDARFARADFKGTADFSGAEFDAGAYFLDAKFHAQVTFAGAKFHGEASFAGAEFHEAVNFSGAEFHEAVNFSGAEFHAEAVFFRAEFDAEADFFGAEFDAWVYFRDAEFHAEADFSSAEFDAGARFSDAEFDAGAEFALVRFQKSAVFDGFSAGGLVNFVGTTFHPKGSRDEIWFASVPVSTTPFLRFEEADLSRVSFQRTDVSQVQFVGCTWAKKPEPRFWPLRLPLLPLWQLRLRPFHLPGPRVWPFRLWMRRRTAIYDEIVLDGRKAGRNWLHKVRVLFTGDRSVKGQLALVAETYRQLRINYEASRQEVEAGDFYIGQMEMRRQDPSEHWLYRLLLNIYRALGSYGEAYIQPFIWYALVFAPLFALGYWLLGTATYAEGVFSALTAGRLFQDVPQGIVDWEKLLLYFNTLVNILLIALTVIALRRRFHR